MTDTTTTNPVADVRQLLIKHLRRARVDNPINYAAAIEADMRMNKPLFLTYFGVNTREVGGIDAPKVGRPEKYTKDDCAEALRACAADTGGVVSISAYVEWRNKDSPDKNKVPTYPSIMKRFGTFEDACTSAGVTFDGKVQIPVDPPVKTRAVRTDAWTLNDYETTTKAFVAWCDAHGMDATVRAFIHYRSLMGDEETPSKTAMSAFFKRYGGWSSGIAAMVT